jgi:hypothetical protein
MHLYMESIKDKGVTLCFSLNSDGGNCWIYKEKKTFKEKWVVSIFPFCGESYYNNLYDAIYSISSHHINSIYISIPKYFMLPLATTFADLLIIAKEYDGINIK